VKNALGCGGVVHSSEEYRVTSKDGTIRFAQIHAAPVSGKIIVVLKDFTERIQAEQAVQEGREMLQLILDSTAEATYGIDVNGLCTFCNKSCLRILGYDSKDELLGRNMHYQIHHTLPDGTEFPAHDCRIFKAFQVGKGPHVDDEVLWRKDGTSFPAEYWSYPQWKEGKIVGAVVTFLDITWPQAGQEPSATDAAADCTTGKNGIRRSTGGRCSAQDQQPHGVHYKQPFLTRQVRRPVGGIYHRDAVSPARMQ
jgi:PAS domain S-box-containing protein